MRVGVRVFVLINEDIISVSNYHLQKVSNCETIKNKSSLKQQLILILFQCVRERTICVRHNHLPILRSLVYESRPFSEVIQPVFLLTSMLSYSWQWTRVLHGDSFHLISTPFPSVPSLLQPISLASMPFPIIFVPTK